MYGIGLAAEGINRGIEQHRQIKRQETDDEQRRKMQEMQMQNYGLQMESTRQQMGQRATDAEWTAGQRDRLTTEQGRQDLRNGILQDLQLDNREGAADKYGQFFGFATGRFDVGEDGSPVLAMGDLDESGNFVPALVTQYDAGREHDLVKDPEAFFADLDADMEAVEQAKAAAEQARIERQHDLMKAAVRKGSIQGRIGEDGRFGITNAPDDVIGDPTANQRDVTDIMQAFGFSRAEAWRFVKTAREEHPAKAIREIAADLLRNSFEYSDDPDAAYERATELYHRINQTGQGYGVPQAQQGPLDQVVQGASQKIAGQKRERMLAEAEELAQENPADVARIAGLLVREGVMTEPEAQEWQRTRGRRPSAGILPNQFDQWQQR